MSDTNKVVSLLGSFVFIAAFSVLIGWYFSIAYLISITASMTAMNPVTAIGLLLISIHIIITGTSKDPKAFSAAKVLIAIIVLLVGGIKLLDYAGFVNVHIDKLLFADRLNNKMLQNSVAPTTALMFLLLGIVLLNTAPARKVKKIINDIIIFSTFLISYLGVIGYVYSLETFYRIGPFVPMALNTAICFNMLTIALFLSSSGYLSRIFFSRYIGGKVVRRAILLVLLIPPAFGYSRLIFERAHFYNGEYGVVLDTTFLVMIVLLFVFYYANMLNKNDRERKNAESAIKQSEEKYRSLVFTLKESIVYFDRDRNILFYNPSFSEMTGYDQQELLGQSIEQLIPEEHRQTSKARMADRLRGIPEDYESQILHKDGTKITVSITARPIIKDGIPNSFLSTMIDITERKKREEDIEAFSASAAHDLSAPLVRIEMLGNYILDLSKDHLNSEDVEYLEIILKTAVDMRQLLKDLLLFARIGAEKISKVPIDMNEMVKDIIDNVAPSAAVIHVDNLPVGYGEPSAVKQVWTNLILNAIKYSSKKDKSAVEISANTTNDKNVYYVKDNGAGFDMADSSKLFAPFKRLHSDFEGNGLGLPIVKRIIEKHGGKIWAEGEKNKGAVFYFTL